MRERESQAIEITSLSLGLGKRLKYLMITLHYTTVLLFNNTN